MVNADGSFLNTTWSTKDGKNFSAGINQFIASVATNKVTIIAINDQPDGKVKKNSVLTYQPQLYLGNTEVKDKTVVLLPVDPVNENYINNTLEWDYSICKRRLRIIEGSILGSWVFATKPNGEVRIKYNQTGDSRLRLGRFRVNDDEEVIKLEDFDELAKFGGYPVTISDSRTYYPDADPETTSVDGQVDRSGVDETWATIRAGAGVAFADSNNYLELYIKASGTTDQFVLLHRLILLFDTSVLADGAVISAATLSLYGVLKTDGLACTPDINIYASTPASNTALQASDYGQTGATAYCATPITYANWKTADPFWNDFSLNADGIAAISKTGISKFAARNANYDVANVKPAWVASETSYLIPYSSEKGVGFKPKLVVTYTVPVIPGTAVLSLTPFAPDFWLKRILRIYGELKRGLKLTTKIKEH